MNTVPPRAQIRADVDTSTREISVSIDIMGHGCTVPLTLTEARAIRDQITAYLATWGSSENHRAPADVQSSSVDPTGDASSHGPDRDPQVSHLLDRERAVRAVSDLHMPYRSVTGRPEVTQ